MTLPDRRAACSSLCSAYRFTEIQVTPAVEAKLWEQHGQLTQLDVEEAMDELLEAPRLHIDPDHGARILARGKCERHGQLFVALAFVNPEEGVWSLITAFQCDDEYWDRATEDGANE